MTNVTLRFAGELGRFLPYARREGSFAHGVEGAPAVKDVIEALGVPHTEVGAILANGAAVGFAYRVREGDHIEVYSSQDAVRPAGDAVPAFQLQPTPPEPPRFVLDVHLGRLAAYLRMLGFDTAYATACDDEVLAAISAREGRILLSRDVGLLKRGNVTHGHFVRATASEEQLVEVIRHYRLADRTTPFTRCLRCNGLLAPAAREAVLERVPPKVRAAHDEFRQCQSCGQVYWKGTHYERMQGLLARLERERGITGSSHAPLG